MKLLKYKMIGITAFFLLSFSVTMKAELPVRAVNISRENKFKDPFPKASTFTLNNESEGSLRGGITPGGSGDTGQGEEKDSAPVGDALLLLAGLVLAYGIYINRKQQIQQLVKNVLP
ncbi:MAG: hypothetical protein LBN18_00605 [Dysgonamonadaceae bacterium]|nr:hypothetical protein [Dysgonamonadaceae bacterium]